MDIKALILAIGITIGMVLIVCLIIQERYLAHKIKVMAERNEKLRNENIGLMKHNGKLYDENQMLKGQLDNKNIPSFDPW